MSENQRAADKMPRKREHGFGGPGGRMAMPGEKPKHFKATMGKLIAYIKPYLPMIIVSTLMAVASTIFSAIGPDRLRAITALIQEGLMSQIDMKAVGRIGLTLAVLYGLGFVFNYVQGFIMNIITQRVSKKMRTEISKKINRLPLKYFDSTSFGDVMSRVTNDVDTIAQTLNNSIGSFVTAVTMFFGSIVMMFYTNVFLALAAILSTIVGFVFMQVIIKHSQKYFKAQQYELGRINGHIEEIYTGHNVVKAYNGEEKAREEFHEINGKLQSSAWKSQFISGLMMPLMHFIGNFGYVVVCVLGAVLLVNGYITDFGVIVAFMIYIRLFTQPLAQIAQTATALQSTAAAGERVFTFLEESELPDESGKTAVLPVGEVRGDIEFEHVKFGYNEDKVIIKDFSATVKAGQKIAIVGSTGAGKTTIVNLLMRFYDLGGGSIKIDGINIADLKRENVHDLFCMVLQDTWLFEGTVKENIIYNKPDIDDEELKKICKVVGVHHFIKTLPNGYSTVLSDKANLSVGQKQLMTIARAMVENAPMLILDEATSSVDTRTEVLIQAAMDKLMQGRTSFVIAHRLSTIKNSDLILVMKDGNIVESGNHTDLLSQGGVYAELYNSQFEQAG
ncbi:MAG: ABC transporter ATP-binding protein/permease [Oscillospiraceae bacterium]|jgi:ATP-binding cassette subfamily B protein|nr:ABC transporter ATP-binding protein/permease [Oscillospiraceae bacterium]